MAQKSCLTYSFHGLTKIHSHLKSGWVATVRSPQAAIIKEPLRPLCSWLRVCRIFPRLFSQCNQLKSEFSLADCIQREQVEWKRREITQWSVKTQSILSKFKPIIDISCLCFLKCLNLSYLGQKAFILTEEHKRRDMLFTEDRKKTMFLFFQERNSPLRNRFFYLESYKELPFQLSYFEDAKSEAERCLYIQHNICPVLSSWQMLEFGFINI